MRALSGDGHNVARAKISAVLLGSVGSGTCNASCNALPTRLVPSFRFRDYTAKWNTAWELNGKVVDGLRCGKQQPFNVSICQRQSV
jgi:hypothetical protein